MALTSLIIENIVSFLFLKIKIHCLYYDVFSSIIVIVVLILLKIIQVYFFFFENKLFHTLISWGKCQKPNTFHSIRINLNILYNETPI